MDSADATALPLKMEPDEADEDCTLPLLPMHNINEFEAPNDVENNSESPLPSIYFDSGSPYF